jgi:hypothetical protein
MPGRSPASLATRALRRMPLVLVAIVAAASITFAGPGPVEAAGPKVVIVVGPSHGSTSLYIQRARRIARQARAYGARVVQLYTPKATWANVKRAARGANVFIYLGHGYGHPSPYGALDRARMNGLGLNPVAGRGRTQPVRYYGEAQIGSQLRFARGAVVILHHLCYASGNAEPGMPEAGWAVARRRVDNFAAGFLRAGAGAVIADAHGDLAYELRIVLKQRGNLLGAWRDDPAYNDHERQYRSVRRPGYIAYLDPDGRSSGFYRSLVTKRNYTTTWVWRQRTSSGTKRLVGVTTTRVLLRAGADVASTSRGGIRAGARLTVTGALVRDRLGRTWAPVRTPAGRVGYVAAWKLRFGGRAATTTEVQFRTGGSTTKPSLGTVNDGTRVTVLASWADGNERVWLKVRTGTGRVGWMAAWLMRG